MRSALASMVLFAGTMAWGCHTVQGAGRDVESGGKAVRTAAAKTDDAIKKAEKKEHQKCKCCCSKKDAANSTK